MKSVSFLVTLSMLGCAAPPPPRGWYPNKQISPPTSCAGRAALDSAIRDTVGITEMPRIRMEGVLPDAPRVARFTGVGDSVLVGIVVNADGRPDTIAILRHAQSQYRDAYDSAAVHYVLALTFWPGCNGSNAVRVRTAVPVIWTRP